MNLFRFKPTLIMAAALSSKNFASSALVTNRSIPTKEYDLVVIGGGSAGLTAAKFAATFDKSAVIVEKAKLGGDCTWTGCVPSKALIASANVAHTARNAANYGINTGNVDINWKAIKDRINARQEHIYEEDDSPSAMEALGIDTIEGSAQFKSSKIISVKSSDGHDTEIIAKEGVVIATGASPILPDIEGLKSVKFVTYENIFTIDELPKRMTVVGGGPIGSELSQAFSRLGVDVTIIATQLLPKEDVEVSKIIEQVFENEKINIVKGRLSHVTPSGSNHKATVTTNKGEEIDVVGDLLLIATGRCVTLK